MDNLHVYIAVFSLFIATALALECYTCVEQDHPRDCEKQTRRCEPFQDACTSYVRWGIPPKWNPRGDRRYYISKDCDTMQGCDKRQAATTTTCKRDWWTDWACVECCTGDLCNYWVKLGASSVHSSTIIIVAACVSLLGLQWIRR